MPTPASSHGGGTLVSRTTITAAQVRAMRATPIQLVPAQGSGIALLPEAVVFVLNTGFGVFGAAFGVTLDVCSDLTLASSLFPHSATSIQQALAGGAANNVVYESFGGLVQDAWSGQTPLWSNSAFLMYASTADPTGGAGTITAYASYSVVAL